MMFAHKNKKGFILIQSIVFGSIAVIIISGLVNWAVVNLKVSKRAVFRERSLQIAEAGIDYYRWHLAHAPQDFKDGTNQPGPYVHNFYDKDGVLVGTYTLTITAPPSGSTLVKVQSQGKVLDDTTIKRTILTQLAIPSLAKYAVVANDDMRFGEGTEVFGPIHSNGGIRFDGFAHNIISSAQTSYDDPDHNGANEFGVHTHVNAPPSSGVNDAFRANEAPPTSPVPSRPDVFEAGRQFPVPAVDFTGFTSDLAQIKTDAQAAGKYLSSSGVLGYKIVLRTDDKYDVYKVNTLKSAPGGCSDDFGQSGWGTWTIGTSGGSTTFVATYNNPTNGLIFVEDHVWVEGAINTARITIASGKFPDNASTRTSITVNNDLKYTNYDGQDVIALIAQNNINVGLGSEDDLEIDAALIAQNGRAGRYYYNNSCKYSSTNWYNRTILTLYGMIGSNDRYGFAYTDGTGYATRKINYDANLLYGPPPSFPLTSDQYSIVSWEEVEI